MKVMRVGPAGFGEATPSAPKNAATSAFGGTGKPGGGILPLATRSRTFSQVAGVCCGALNSTGAQIQVRGLQLCVVTGEAMRRDERCACMAAAMPNVAQSLVQGNAMTPVLYFAVR